jgi:thiamine pyrophosphate-dependent acetolactate synthase large subunit-like protein
MKTYEAVARTLVGCGLKTMFGLMGDANMQYIVDYMEHGGHYVGAVHETGAVAMADGYGRVTGTVGVATATHGPGLMNTLTALTEAVRNRSRLLLLTGETKAGFDLSPQVVDIAAVIAPTGAGYERVHRADTFAADFRRALRRVLVEGRPVVLNIPFDLLNAEAGDPDVPRPGSLVEAIPVPAVGPTSIDDALGLLVSAKRPVILAGHGAVLAGARDDLVRLADLVDAPLATSLLGKDFFRGHPRNIGICGTVSSPIGAATVAEADCVVAFGASLNKFTAGPALAGKRLVHCDVDPQRIGAFTNVDVSVLGDAKAVAAAMVDGLVDARFEVAAGNTDLADRLAAASPRDEFTDRSDGDTLDLRTAMVMLDEQLPIDRTVVTDAGRFLLGPWKYLHVNDPMRFVHTTNFASIGLGLGNAIGAAVAHPDQLTVAVVGDGGFMMHLGEFSTAARHGLPMLVVVLNDGSYGAEYTALKLYGMDPDYSLITWPDLAPVADALGGRGVTVRSAEQLTEAVAGADSLTGPLLLDVKVNPGVDIWAA